MSNQWYRLRPAYRVVSDEPVVWVSFRCDDCRLQRIVKCSDMTVAIDCCLPDGWKVLDGECSARRLSCGDCMQVRTTRHLVVAPS